MDATPTNRLFSVDRWGEFSTENVIVQSDWLASGDDEIEYWRTRKGGSISRKVLSGRLMEGWRMRMSRGLRRLLMTSSVKRLGLEASDCSSA